MYSSPAGMQSFHAEALDKRIPSRHAGHRDENHSPLCTTSPSPAAPGSHISVSEDGWALMDEEPLKRRTVCLPIFHHQRRTAPRRRSQGHTQCFHEIVLPDVVR